MIKKTVLEVRDLGKRFKVYPGARGRLKEWLTFGRRSYHKDFWSLQGVSFDLHEGEFLGIIGPNGAGKSTLLKVITGILDPTAGSCKAEGRVLSLLELSGGLDGSLTGRENIIRTTTLLGFPKEYAVQKMDAIEDFAELGEFFDRPMETYSSGMRIRLAFSMFAFLDCDILILDEVLAVGDIFFKQKCYARLEELIKNKVSIILVTQSTGVVTRYCDSVIVMNKGKIIYQGEADKAVQKYFEIQATGKRMKAQDTYLEEEYLPEANTLPATLGGISYWPPEQLFSKTPQPETPKRAKAALTHLILCDETGRPRQVFQQGEKAYFYLAYQLLENIGAPIVELNISTVQNMLIHGKNSAQAKSQVPLRVMAGETLRIRQGVKLDLRPGEYIFSLSLFSMHPEDYRNIDAMLPVEFKERRAGVAMIKQAGTFVVTPPSNSRTIGVHTGICDLEGEMQVSVQSSPKNAV
jgi:lipopolysaccharide transport system ATP-binding protein